jgi:hypothetical protein
MPPSGPPIKPGGSVFGFDIRQHRRRFYLETRDPKYTPIWKLEPFKQAYKRESGPFAFWYRRSG